MYRGGRAINWKSIQKFCNDSFCISYQKQKRNSKSISGKFLKVIRINTCDRELRNCDTISECPVAITTITLCLIKKNNPQLMVLAGFEPTKCSRRYHSGALNLSATKVVKK